MAWEQIIRKQGGQRPYGLMWEQVPCVGVLRAGLSFNVPMQTTFSLREGSYVLIFVDKNNRRIGIKVATTQEEQDIAFKLQGAAGKGGQTLHISCKPLLTTFADCRGHAYRAHLNAGERVIEVSLCVDNCTIRH